MGDVSQAAYACPGELLEQLHELIAGKHAAIVAGTPQNNVTACLVVNLEAIAFQSPDDLARLHSGQANHHAGSRATLNRPMNCSSLDSMGISSPCLRKLAQ